MRPDPNHSFSFCAVVGLRVAIGLMLAAVAASCVTAPSQTGGLAEFVTGGDLGLSVSCDAASYAPGQAVVVTARLTNAQAEPRDVALPGHESVRFYVRKAAVEKSGTPVTGAVDVAEPVWSPLEPRGERATLAPGGDLARSFVFTSLSFERGNYELLAVYEDGRDAAHKTYSRPVAFRVAGEQAAVQRTVDGLVTEATAERLARASWGRPDARAEARLIVDEKGFRQWWVNLSDAGETRSWFINPYLGKVWKEAQPFGPEVAAAGVVPLDSKRLSELKAQRPTGGVAGE